MLPYPSYLRVYEPIGALDGRLQDAIRAEADAARFETLEAEQLGALTRTVSSTFVDPGDAAGVYVMQRAGEQFYCPVDLPLRSWLSMASLVDSLGGAMAELIMPPELLAVADDDFLRWRRDNPKAVPHIQQATWGVPRTWFLLVVEDERTGYDDGAGPSVRYRATLEDARARLEAGHRTLLRVIDDSELIDELASLLHWLESFDEGSWVELDYAGVAALLGNQLSSDHSAREIHQAVDALSRGDLASATVAYRAFEERWRVVNGLERAN